MLFFYVIFEVKAHVKILRSSICEFLVDDVGGRKLFELTVCKIFLVSFEVSGLTVL